MKENSLYIQYIISLLFQTNATLHVRKIALKKPVSIKFIFFSKIRKCNLGAKFRM